jgi:hypothetical protein
MCTLTHFCQYECTTLTAGKSTAKLGLLLKKIEKSEQQHKMQKFVQSGVDVMITIFREKDSRFSQKAMF